MVELETAKYVANYEEQTAQEPPQSSDPHPSVYVHEECGNATQMPSNIRANYLADPYFYGSDTICAGCGIVSDRACYWVDTGENLHAYMKRLKKQRGTQYQLVRWLLPAMLAVFFTISYAQHLVNQGEAITAEKMAISMFLSYALAWYPSKFIRLFMCRLGIV